jgi:hypothetical protein
MAEIWISAPQSEHLIEGRMLNGRSVSMAGGGGGGDGRVWLCKMVPDLSGRINRGDGFCG